MGKNSNAHKSLGTLALDIQREREQDAAKAARRARNEMKAGMMVDDDAAQATADALASDAHVSVKKTKKFGKIVRRKKMKVLPGVSAIKKSLSTGKSSGGIRKPSAVMRKTLKKLAKKREMVRRPPCTARARQTTIASSHAHSTMLIAGNGLIASDIQALCSLISHRHTLAISQRNSHAFRRKHRRLTFSGTVGHLHG
jgi:hypothetical protein